MINTVLTRSIEERNIVESNYNYDINPPVTNSIWDNNPGLNFMRF